MPAARSTDAETLGSHTPASAPNPRASPAPDGLSAAERYAHTCEMCGNVYDKTFVVEMGGVRHVFDSFECAIAAIAPLCAHCRCRIVGHGMEKGGRMFCCAHCAEREGAPEMRDRV